MNAAINAAIQSVRLITFIIHTNKCMIYFDAKIYTMLVTLIQIYMHRTHYVCVCVYVSYIYIVFTINMLVVHAISNIY